MADEKPDPQVFINGIDLSAHVKDLKITRDDALNDLPFGAVPGMKPMEPTTITGYWSSGCYLTCGNCGGSFEPGDIPVATITHEPTGVSVVACPACAVALLELNQGD